MFRLGQLAMSRQPLLAQCSMSSLLAAMMKAAEMGLEPDGTKGALVPFKNKKTGKMEATFIPMWQGLSELVRGTGQIAALDTDIVCEHDRFVFIKGLEPKLEHTPAMRGDRGEMVGAWAMVRYVNGGSDMEWMSNAEIDKIRQRSKAKDYGPWVTDFTEMARKTVFRRLCKRLPKSTPLIVALDAENRFEAGETIDVASLPELPEEAMAPPPPTATEKLAEATRKRGRPPKETPVESALPTVTSPEAGEATIESSPIGNHGDNGNKLVDSDTVQEIVLYCERLGENTADIPKRFGVNKLSELTNAEAGQILGELLDKVSALDK